MTSGAQDYSVSRPFKLAGAIEGCAESGNRTVAMLSKESNQLHVRIWKPESEVLTLIVPNGKESTYQAELHWIGETLYLLTVTQDAAASKRTLFLQVLEKNGFSSPKQLGEVEKGKAMEPGDFYFVANKQKDKLAIISENPHVNGEKEGARVAVFGEDFKELWTSSFTYDLDSKRKRQNVPVLDSIGNLFILKKFSMPNDQQFHLYALGKGKSKPSHTRINLSGQKIAEVGIGISPNGQPEIAGFTFLANQNFYEGYFFVRYDENLNVRVSSSDRFKDETCKLVSYKQTIKKVGFEDFNLVQLLSYQNKVVIALEMNRVEQRKNQKVGGTEPWLVKGPAVVLVLDGRGNLVWTKGIQKDNAMPDRFAVFSALNIEVVEDDSFLLAYNNSDKQGNPSQFQFEYWQPKPTSDNVKLPELKIPQGFVLHGGVGLEKSMLLHNPLTSECIFVVF